jgi:hypothetical protein
MPATLTDPGFGVKPFNPNVPGDRERVSRDYFNAMWDRYGGDPDKVLAAYNAGPGSVDKGRIPDSTQQYISDIKKIATGNRPMLQADTGNNTMSAAMQILNNPWASEGQKVVARALLEKALVPQRPITVSPGATLLDPVTHKPIYTAPGGPHDPETIARDEKARIDALQSSDTVKDNVEGIKRGDLPPVTTGLYRIGAAVKAGLAKDGVNLSKLQLEWESARKQIQSLNGPHMMRYAGLANSVINTVDEVSALADQMKQRGITPLNHANLLALVNLEGNSERGQLASRYIAAVNTLKEEFANLANGGYAPTEPAWRLANEQINADYGVDQLNASLKEVRRLLNYRLQNVPNFGTLGPFGPNQYIGTQGVLPSIEAGAQAPQSGKGDMLNTPTPGTVEDGYRFKGGDPSNPANWEKVQ